MNRDVRSFRDMTAGTLRATHRPRSSGAATEVPPRLHWKTLLSATILGVVLLVLSSLITAAAAFPADTAWPSAGLVWVLPAAATLIVLWRARTGRAVARGMCFINGVVSLGLSASATFGQRYISEPLPLPGPVRGVAVASGLLAIAAFVLGLAFFAAWYALSDHGPAAHGGPDAKNPA